MLGAREAPAGDESGAAYRANRRRAVPRIAAPARNENRPFWWRSSSEFGPCASRVVDPDSGSGWSRCVTRVYQCARPRLWTYMKDVSGGQSADESRPLSRTRRTRRGTRRILAGLFLAATMLAFPLVLAGSTAAGPPKVATLNANQISQLVAADPGAPTGLFFICDIF